MCIFVGYSEDIKRYRHIQPHSHDIIIRRDVKFDENILACEPDSTIVPSSSSSNFLDRFPNRVFANDSEDENPPLPDHVPPIAQAPMLPRWVRSTRQVAGDLAGDPRYQRQTCS